MLKVFRAAIALLRLRLAIKTVAKATPNLHLCIIVLRDLTGGIVSTQQKGAASIPRFFHLSSSFRVVGEVGLEPTKA